MEKRIHILKNALLTVFFSFYAIFCVRISNVSIQTIGIITAFWIITGVMILLEKNKKKYLYGIGFVFTMVILKWGLFCGILEPIFSKATSLDIVLLNDSVEKHLVINICLCVMYISGILMRETHTVKRKTKEE